MGLYFWQLDIITRKEKSLKTNYLIRLDDACPTMNHQNWDRIEVLLDKYGVNPMVGVIPHNENSNQQIDSEDGDFWDLVHSWEQKGWTIAMHGFNHVYSSRERGINPVWDKSEFAGHPIELQREKIRKGISIMREHNINPRYFFAPSHTFDENTLVALREESDIRIISDTIGAKPYRYKDFVFIPQQSGHPIRLPFGGLLTICYHPNSMGEEDFAGLEHFFVKCKDKILSFEDIDLSHVKGKSIRDRILYWLYFTRRKLR